VAGKSLPGDWAASHLLHDDFGSGPCGWGYSGVMDESAAVPLPSDVLIVRPSALGDICRSVPVLVSLRRALPSARIDWLVNDAFQDAVRHHPDLDAVVPFPRDALARALRTGRGAAQAWAWLQTLRGRRYDLVIDLQGLLRSGLVTWLTGSKRRVGFANAGEMAWVGYNERHRVDSAMHSVDRMLALVKHAGFEPVPEMRLHVGDEDDRWLDRWLADCGIDAQAGYACLAPTARWRCKCWPIERYAEVARRLVNSGRAGSHLVVLAAPNERDQIASLPDLLGPAAARVHFPETGVGRFLALVRRARLVVGNDSAAMHMAVGFDRPLVAIFGMTRPESVGPYGRDDSVVTPPGPSPNVTYRHRPDDQTWVNRIDVEQVWQKVESQLDASRHGADQGAKREPQETERR